MDIYEWTTIELTDTKQLPVKDGCYALLCNEAVLYIGRAKLLWTRLQNLNLHKRISEIRDTVDEHLMLAYSVDDYDNEKELILKYQPKYNIEYLTKWQSR